MYVCTYVRMYVCMYVSPLAREHPSGVVLDQDGEKAPWELDMIQGPSCLPLRPTWLCEWYSSEYARIILVHFVNMGGSSTYYSSWDIITSLPCLVLLVLTTRQFNRTGMQATLSYHGVEASTQQSVRRESHWRCLLGCLSLGTSCRCMSLMLITWVAWVQCGFGEAIAMFVSSSSTCGRSPTMCPDRGSALDCGHTSADSLNDYRRDVSPFYVGILTDMLVLSQVVLWMKCQRHVTPSGRSGQNCKTIMVANSGNSFLPNTCAQKTLSTTWGRHTMVDHRILHKHVWITFAYLRLALVMLTVAKCCMPKVIACRASIAAPGRRDHSPVSLSIRVELRYQGNNSTKKPKYCMDKLARDAILGRERSDLVQQVEAECASLSVLDVGDLRQLPSPDKLWGELHGALQNATVKLYTAPARSEISRPKDTTTALERTHSLRHALATRSIDPAGMGPISQVSLQRLLVLFEAWRDVAAYWRARNVSDKLCRRDKKQWTLDKVREFNEAW